MQYTKEDLAYIAGLYDGEGCITLVKQIEKRRSKEYIYYNPKASIGMTNRKAIDFVAERFKGNIWFIKKNGVWKPLYHFDISNCKRVFVFLKEIYPYLQVKKEQARIVLEFIASRENLPNNVRWGESSYTTEHHKLCEEIRKLNKRGITPLTPILEVD